MEKITWKDFEKIGLRVGTIVEVEDFPRPGCPPVKSGPERPVANGSKLA